MRFKNLSTRRAFLPLEVNAHNLVGRDAVSALWADRVEARAHGGEIDFLSRHCEAFRIRATVSSAE